jgi:hypothetical protein
MKLRSVPQRPIQQGYRIAPSRLDNGSLASLNQKSRGANVKFIHPPKGRVNPMLSLALVAPAISYG